LQPAALLGAILSLPATREGLCAGSCVAAALLAVVL
jgi:hypothetical protein